MNEYTPWNPSKRAERRVKNPLPVPCDCHLCKGNRIEVVHHDKLYGRAYGQWPWAYRCQDCGAYVGMHPLTAIPLGTLADAPLRQARKDCKAPFEALWKSGKLTRDQAYTELAAALGLKEGEAHFGWFDVDQCRRAQDWATSRILA